MPTRPEDLGRANSALTARKYGQVTGQMPGHPLASSYAKSRAREQVPRQARDPCQSSVQPRRKPTERPSRRISPTLSGTSRRCLDRSWSHTSPEWPTPERSRAGRPAACSTSGARAALALRLPDVPATARRGVPHTVRAWFLGLNPQLDDHSPAQSIRDGDFRDVLVAARAFLAGG